MIKVAITGKVHSVGAIKPVGKSSYFNQVIVLHQPEEIFRGKKINAEYYVVTVFSNATTDSRFVQPEKQSLAIGAEAKAECYLKGERWIDLAFAIVYGFDGTQWKEIVKGIFLVLQMVILLFTDSQTK